jgi:plasmid stabilization system protein ParE
MHISFHPNAEAEFNEAALWYGKQRQGLDIEFVKCIDEAINRVKREPDSYPFAYKHIRKTIVKRFPFILLYENLKEEIRIIAIFHTRRAPKQWMKRN